MNLVHVQVRIQRVASSTRDLGVVKVMPTILSRVFCKVINGMRASGSVAKAVSSTTSREG